MARSLTGPMLTATQATVVMPILLAEIDSTAGLVNMWNGHGTLPWDSKSWVGVGKFLGMTPITELNQVQASGTVIRLSGIPSELITMAMSQLQRGRPGKVYLGALDANFAIIADPYLAMSGRVDSAAMSDSGQEATISVNIEGRLIQLNRTKERRYTDKDQRIESPTDAGFSGVDTLQDFVIEWHRNG